MPITNAQIVNFSNQKARVFADSLEQTYQTAKRFQQEYEAIGGDAAIVDTTDVIVDGSESDGRKTITARQARALKASADQIVTWFEAGTPSRISQIQKISVNGQARF